MSEEQQEDKPLTGDVMDVEGIALYLGIATSTVYDKVQGREIPHTRLGNLIRFRKRDIDEWLSENSVRPRPSLQRALAEAAQRFFLTNWLESIGLDPEELDREKALAQFKDSLDLMILDSRQEQ